MLVQIVRNAPMLYSGPVTGITGMDTPGVTNCTVKNGGFYVCDNSVEDMQYPSYSTGNGRDVIWEGACPAPAAPAARPRRAHLPREARCLVCVKHPAVGACAASGGRQERDAWAVRISQERSAWTVRTGQYAISGAANPHYGSGQCALVSEAVWRCGSRVRGTSLGVWNL